MRATTSSLAEDTSQEGHIAVVLEKETESAGGAPTSELEPSSSTVDPIEYDPKRENLLQEVKRLRRRNADQSEVILGHLLEIGSLKADKESLKRRLSSQEANAQCNSFSRIDEGKFLPIWDINSTNRSEYQVKDLFHCRCLEKCVFKYLQFETPSPTQMNKIVQLKDMKSITPLSENDVYVLSQKTVPGVVDELVEKTIPIVSKCPSLKIWIQDIPKWDELFSSYHAQLMLDKFGPDLLKPAEKDTDMKKLHIIHLPGITQTLLHVIKRNVLEIKDYSSGAEVFSKWLSQKLPNIVLFIIPYDTDRTSAERWQLLINMVPKTMNVSLCPGHYKGANFSGADIYSRMFNGMKRSNGGELSWISPDDIVPTKEKTVLEICKTETIEEYWTCIMEMKTHKGIEWPRVELHDPEKVNKKTVQQPEVKPKDPAPQVPSGSGGHRGVFGRGGGSGGGKWDQGRRDRGGAFSRGYTRRPY